MCVIFVENAIKLSRVSAFPPDMLFSTLKHRLLKIGFTVYEFIHNEGRRLPANRRVILTHLTFRDETQCTKAVVSKVPAIQIRGHTEFINSSAVVYLSQWGNCVCLPAILQTSSIVTSEAASSCPKESCVEQANAGFQQAISQVKLKRWSAQDIGEDVVGACHKQARSSSSRAVRQLRSRDSEPENF